MNKIRLFFLLMLLALQGGCSTVSYYAQAINGHFKLMRAREPIEKVLKSPETDEALRKKLQLLTEAREYASNALYLPNNDSYSTFVKTGRKYVTWNVVAAPEFSLKPKTWCFPIAGCVSYRGYFSEERANAYAEIMREQGLDTIVGGASAYSTLGWFEDPLLDTMIRGGDIRVVSILFHELAHQELYVKDDSNFNEAFASFVEQAGVRQWLLDNEQGDRIPGYDAYLQRQIEFGELLKTTRQELVALYRDEQPEAQWRDSKAAVFSRMQENYIALKEQWDGYTGYDGWFKREINNARLLSVATYRRWVPAFKGIFEESNQDFVTFYEAVKALSKLPRAERDKVLQGYIDNL